ncbi:MAG TPA: hypothetical protein VGM14_24595 [Streptosporangiaceae bacterium]|jgi:hypothetical protein
MAQDGNTTQIDSTYLNNLKGQLQGIQTDVQSQLNGIGAGDSSLSGWISAVDSSLTVSAGATNFNAGKALNTALGKMGGTIHDQLTWLNKVLTDMIGEITTTVNSFGNTESLNTESVATLIGDFQHTINDMNNPPGSSGTSTPSTTTPPPNGTPAP